MIIGFDLSQTAENKTGCGFFADQLIRALAKIDNNNRYILYPTFYGYRNRKYSKATCPSNNNMTLWPTDLSWSELNRWWDKPQDRTEKLGNPDVIHSNNFSCPKDIRSKIVMTIYDLSFLEIPDATTETNRLVCFQGVFEASLYADHLIMISHATKNAFKRFFPHYPDDRISVIHLASRPTITRLESNHSKLVLSKMGIKAKDYWLGVGTLEPRKNYRLLIEAYAQLVSRGENRPLYIAGGAGWLESDIGDFVIKYGLAEKIRFLGYVSDEQLSALYSSCFAFIYPSLYEGFGLPIVEAMSCGAPVIASNTTSMPEVVGDAGVLFNPDSVESLVYAMQELLTNVNQREVLIARGLERSKLFSWEKSAKAVLDIYEKVVASPEKLHS